MRCAKRWHGTAEYRVLHDLHRSDFLRPRERLYELLTLQQAESRDGLTVDDASDALFDRRTLAGQLVDIESRGLLERSECDGRTQLRLTESGRRRLHFLLVDFVREAAGLHTAALELLRRSLIPLALAGVQRVAFYPFGETAESAFAALDGLGFDLVAIVDDAPAKHDLRFHNLRVRAPDVLRELAPDAVIVTTAVFQDQIVDRLRLMNLAGTRIHTF
jgi:hypothetical protein